MTKMIGRRTAIAATISAPLLARHGWAQSAGAGAYPGGRTVRVVVPFAAGGTTDILGRVLAQRLNEKFKVPVVADNRPGAGGNIGAHNARNVGLA